MLYCPNGHGPKEGRFCPECGAALVAVLPSTGDAVNIRSPQAQAVAAPTIVLPGATAEVPPVLVKCPWCGRRNPEAETFDCQGSCGRQNLCLRHFDEELLVCKQCAGQLRGEVEAEERRRREQQAGLEQWRRQAVQAEKQVAELARQEQQDRAALAQAQADLQQARERVRKLEQELADWRGRAERAEPALAQAQADLQQARERIKKLEQELDEWRGRAERAEAQLAEIARKEREAEEARQRNELTLELARGVQMVFVRVPAGEFLMGSDKRKDPEASDDEQPQHRVYLDEYWIGKYPVTNAQYKAFVDATGYAPPEHWKGGQIPKGKENHPVVNVSWHDAMFFCEWAGRITGQRIRLPTEAEWEKAARGTDGRLYPWGNQPPTEKLCNFNLNVGDTTPVGRYSPAGDSPYGCADMAGNVWEWCADWYDEKYYAGSPSRNPSGPGSGQYRVVRGGSWYYGQRDVRAAARRCWFTPGNRNDFIGFRCALSP